MMIGIIVIMYWKFHPTMWQRSNAYIEIINIFRSIIGIKCVCVTIDNIPHCYDIVVVRWWWRWPVDVLTLMMSDDGIYY